MKKFTLILAMLLIVFGMSFNYTKGQYSFNFDRTNLDSYVSNSAEEWYYNSATQKCVKGIPATVATKTYTTEQKCKDANPDPFLFAQDPTVDKSTDTFTFSPINTPSSTPTQPWSTIKENSFFNFQVDNSFTPTKNDEFKFAPTIKTDGAPEIKLFGVPPRDNTPEATKPNFLTSILNDLGFNREVATQYQAPKDEPLGEKPFAGQQLATTTGIFGDELLTYKESEKKGIFSGLFDLLKKNNDDAGVLNETEINPIGLSVTPSRVNEGESISITWNISNKCGECKAISNPTLIGWDNKILLSPDSDTTGSKSITVQKIKPVNNTIVLKIECLCEGKVESNAQNVTFVEKQGGGDKDEKTPGQNINVSIEAKSREIRVSYFDVAGKDFGGFKGTPSFDVVVDTKSEWTINTYGMIGITFGGKNKIIKEILPSKAGEKTTIAVATPMAMLEELYAKQSLAQELEKEIINSQKTRVEKPVEVWFKQCANNQTKDQCMASISEDLVKVTKKFNIVFVAAPEIKYEYEKSNISDRANSDKIKHRNVFFNEPKNNTKCYLGENKGKNYFVIDSPSIEKAWGHVSHYRGRVVAYTEEKDFSKKVDFIFGCEENGKKYFSNVASVPPAEKKAASAGVVGAVSDMVSAGWNVVKNIFLGQGNKDQYQINLDQISSVDRPNDLSVTEQEFLTDPNKPVFDPAILSMPGKEIIPQGGLSDDGPNPTLPPGEGVIDNSWHWYFEEYAYKTKLGDVDSNRIALYGDMKLQKLLNSRWVQAGILLSYINEKNQRSFVSQNVGVFVPKQSGTDTEWHNDGFWTVFEIPRDIKKNNGSIDIETIVVASADHNHDWYKNPTNNYERWRNVGKDYFSIDLGKFVKKNQNCKISLIDPAPKSNFLPNKDPYFSNFKLNMDLSCEDNDLNKSGGEKLQISYKVRCPMAHSSSEISNHFYQDIFFDDTIEVIANLQKRSGMKGGDDEKFHQSINLISTAFLTEKLNEISRAMPEWETEMVNIFGVAERCDVDVELMSNSLNLNLNEYFYLNQCKINIINEHPNKIYCTEKDGQALPIKVKVSFSNCARDNYANMSNADFISNPNPSEKRRTILDESRFWSRYWNGGGVYEQEKNGQIFRADLATYKHNGRMFIKEGAVWDYYFKDLGVAKNMANNPTNVSLVLKMIDFYNAKSFDHTMQFFPEKYTVNTDHFKIFYGSGNDAVKCGNLNDSYGGASGKAASTSIISNALQSIGSFFKGIFTR